MTVPARLARLLLDHGSTADGRVRLQLSQGDLARLIGASRQKVNLYLGRWLAEGILARVGEGLRIRDRRCLEALAAAGER
jgi:hypothetical protein